MIDLQYNPQMNLAGVDIRQEILTSELFTALKAFLIKVRSDYEKKAHGQPRELAEWSFTFHLSACTPDSSFNFAEALGKELAQLTNIVTELTIKKMPDFRITDFLTPFHALITQKEDFLRSNPSFSLLPPHFGPRIEKIDFSGVPFDIPSLNILFECCEQGTLWTPRLILRHCGIKLTKENCAQLPVSPAGSRPSSPLSPSQSQLFVFLNNLIKSTQKENNWVFQLFIEGNSLEPALIAALTTYIKQHGFALNAESKRYPAIELYHQIAQEPLSAIPVKERIFMGKDPSVSLVREGVTERPAFQALSRTQILPPLFDRKGPYSSSEEAWACRALVQWDQYCWPARNMAENLSYCRWEGNDIALTISLPVGGFGEDIPDTSQLKNFIWKNLRSEVKRRLNNTEGKSILSMNFHNPLSIEDKFVLAYLGKPTWLCELHPEFSIAGQYEYPSIVTDIKQLASNPGLSLMIIDTDDLLGHPLSSGIDTEPMAPDIGLEEINHAALTLLARNAIGMPGYHLVFYSLTCWDFEELEYVVTQILYQAYRIKYAKDYEEQYIHVYTRVLICNQPCPPVNSYTINRQLIKTDTIDSVSIAEWREELPKENLYSWLTENRELLKKYGDSDSRKQSPNLKAEKMLVELEKLPDPDPSSGKFYNTWVLIPEEHKNVYMTQEDLDPYRVQKPVHGEILPVVYSLTPEQKAGMMKELFKETLNRIMERYKICNAGYIGNVILLTDKPALLDRFFQPLNESEGHSEDHPGKRIVILRYLCSPIHSQKHPTSDLLIPFHNMASLRDNGVQMLWARMFYDTEETVHTELQTIFEKLVENNLILCVNFQDLRYMGKMIWENFGNFRQHAATKLSSIPPQTVMDLANYIYVEGLTIEQITPWMLINICNDNRKQFNFFPDPLLTEEVYILLQLFANHKIKDQLSPYGELSNLLPIILDFEQKQIKPYLLQKQINDKGETTYLLAFKK